jgi:hypothetical protein
MFGPDLQMTMSATDIVANKQVLRHNGVCSAGLSSAHTLYEPIIQDRVYPTSVRYADMRLVSTRCANRRRGKAAHRPAAAC